MMNYLQTLKKNLENSIEANIKFQEYIKNSMIFDEIINILIKCFKSKGKLVIAGNGGSAADAQHMAAEFVSKFNFDRDPLSAEALTVDTSIITSIANDYDFSKIFSRQIHAKMHKNDIFLAITTSGNSRNILEALNECKNLGIKSILLSGKSGGIAKSISDYSIIVPSNSTQVIQEIHLLIYHSICECIENEFFKNN